MAKLPGINYQTPTRSSGRHDVMGPIRVANAEASALREVGGIMVALDTRLETNKVAKYSASMSNEMAELNALTKNTKNYSPAFLDEHGIDYELDGRETIPAHEVSVPLYKKIAEDIRGRNSGKLTQKGQNVMDRAYASKYGPGITAVMAQQIKWGQEYATAETELDYQESVRAGSMEGAMMIADTARANGTWSHDYYATKVKALPGLVQEAIYLQDLDSINDPDQLEETQSEIVNNPVLSSTQANRMYGAYDSKIRRIEKALEIAAKEEKEETSSLELIDLGTRISEGEQMTGEELIAEVSAMRPADRNTAFSIWNASQSSVTVSNPDSSITAASLIRETLLPDGAGSDFKARRDNVQGQLDAMMRRKDISIDDHRTFTNDLKAVQKTLVESVEYKAVEEDIYALLTGGGKAAFSVFDKSGERAVGLADTIWELNQRALQFGTAFNPTEWWTQKKPSVISKDLEKNIHKWKKSISFQSAVYNGDTYDPKATAESLANQVEEGTISEDYMNLVLTEANRHSIYVADRTAQLRQAREDLQK